MGKEIHNQIESIKASAIDASILDDRNFISFAEFKELSNIGRNTIYSLCKEGTLTRIKVKGIAYLRTDELKLYLIGKGGSIA